MRKPEAKVELMKLDNVLVPRLDVLDDTSDFNEMEGDER